MARIRVLADQLINRIAAGEVVERPSSVVKELVENSLDAGAGRVTVRLAGGGKRLIGVDDDGCGMDRDDALLAVERHATSKLGSSADLEAIRTLGFRGEALSSIAAVSRFLLRTATDRGEGSEVEIRGGRMVAVREVGLARGSSIRAERIFFNVPARRKFLRSDGTELSHVVRVVTRLALAHPTVAFVLLHEDRPLIRVDPAVDPAARIAQIFGRELVDKLLPFGADEPGVRLHGLAGRPLDSLPRGRAQHLFVNGRAVQDRMLSHAISEAYGNTMPRGRHPALFLFLEIDAELVDVNVHPQKAEVRFRGPSQVHDLVREALRAALSHDAVLPELSELRSQPELARRGEIARATLDYLRDREEKRDREPAATASTRLNEPTPSNLPHPTATSTSTSTAAPSPVAGTAAERAAGTPIAPLVAARPAARALAQYRDSYIVAQDAGGLMLVDQHAAHERVLFERYLEEAELNRVEVQRLLFPATCDFAPEELVLLREEAEEFHRLGFRVEPFGGNTVRVDGVPAVAGEVEPRELLGELLGEAGRASSASAGTEPLRHRLVTSAACQAAIKVNHPLPEVARQRLLDDLFATVNPSTCPHGRPTVFRLSLEEIERAFRRR